MTFEEMLKDRGLSQSDCARILGISRQLVNMLVKGAREPGPELKEKIKEKLGYEFLKKNRVVFDHNEVIKYVTVAYTGRDKEIWSQGVQAACEFYGGK